MSKSSSRSNSINYDELTASGIELAEYEVQHVLAQKLKDGVIEYRVRWKGYGPNADTWEPEENLLNCLDLLNKWKQKYAEKQNKTKGINKENQAVAAPPARKRSHSSEDSARKSAKTASKEKKKPEKQTDIRTALTIVGSQPLSNSSSPSSSPPKSDLDAHPDRIKFLEKLSKLKGPPVTIVNEIDNEASPPLQFNIIEEHIYRDGVPKPSDEAMWGCSCKGSHGCALTRPEECSCIEFNHEDHKAFAYTHKGLLKLKDNSRFAIHECNSKCACGPKCANRVVGNGRTLPLEIFKTVNKGWGIRCPVKIPAGMFIDKYVGEIITPEETERRVEINNERGCSYLFDLDKFKDEDDETSQIYTIDGGDYGGVTRFINHSCDPNLLIYAVTKNRSSLDVYDIALFSRKDIKANTELTFQYTHHDDDNDNAKESQKDEGGAKKKTWPCHCGAKNCCGFLW